VKVALPYIIYLHMVLSNFWYDYLINALFFFKKKKKRKKKKEYQGKNGLKEDSFVLYFYTEPVKMHK
jgi:hypothetical protein